MARNKETLIFVLDVSPTMHAHLRYVSKATSSAVEKKLYKQSGDDFGLVLFGTEETDNELRRQIGEGYEAVVSEPIRKIDDKFVRRLRLLPRGPYAGDFVDAVLVAADVFITWIGVGKRGNKRICLITDGQSAVKSPDGDITKLEQAEAIASKLSEFGIKLEVVLIRMMGDGTALESDESVENLEILETLSSGELVQVQTPLHLMAALNPRTTSPTTLFRGDMEITPNAHVKVWVYKKAAQERVPSLKQYSEKAPQEDHTATHEVKMDVEYKYADDPNVTITKDQRAKGYYYGQQLIPVTPEMELSLKFAAEKGIKLLGFTDSSNIPRHYFMKEPNIFIPEPGNEKAIAAVSALARALKDADMVAIARCVWRQAQKNVVIGVLIPNVASDIYLTDTLYFNVIPFAEDIREFGFPSFNDRPASMVPSQAQEEAAVSLIEMLDLSPDNATEDLQPEKTINPVLQRFYHFLYLKIANAETPVPPLDETLKKVVEPDYSAEQDTILQQFCEKFSLVDVQKAKKKKAIEGPEDEPMAAQVDKVGSLNPVQDFEALLARRDSDEWVEKAIQEMKEIISELLLSPSTYDKAADCLIALRRGCVIQEEPELFNRFYRDVVQKCREDGLLDLHNKLVSNLVMLITKEETPDSDVTEMDAHSCLCSIKQEQD